MVSFVSAIGVHSCLAQSGEISPHSNSESFRETALRAKSMSSVVASSKKFSLPPGNYTAIVREVNNTTSVALVEVYDLH